MNTKVDTLLIECESIISETENVYEYITDPELNTFGYEYVEIDDIRVTAEELIELVLQFEQGLTTKAELVETSITLYQDCKYILSEIEEEYSFLMSDDVAKSFSYIRTSVDTIRDIVEKI